MSFIEFTGRLDQEDTPTGGYVPFTGELDQPRGPADTSDPLTRISPSTPSTGAATFSVTDDTAKRTQPPGVGARVQGEVESLRDTFFTGVDQTIAAGKTLNLAAQQRQLQLAQDKLDALVASGKGAAPEAAGLRKTIEAYSKRLPGMVGSAVEAQTDAQRGAAMTTRPAVAKVAAAKTFGEAWDAFKEAPYDVIAGVTAQSLPAMLPALVAGVVAGPGTAAAAMGLSSATVEAGSSLGDFARNAGVDMTDRQAVEAFFADRTNLAAALEYAGKRAGVIGALDAASGGLAGKTIAPPLKSAIGRQAVNLPTQMAAQAGLGAAGEAGAQLATKGEIGEPGQVLMEAVGELGGAPLEVAAFSRDARASLAGKPDAVSTAAIQAAPDIDTAIATAQAAVDAQPVAAATRPGKPERDSIRRLLDEALALRPQEQAALQPPASGTTAASELLATQTLPALAGQQQETQDDIDPLGVRPSSGPDGAAAGIVGSTGTGDPGFHRGARPTKLSRHAAGDAGSLGPGRDLLGEARGNSTEDLSALTEDSRETATPALTVTMNSSGTALVQGDPDLARAILQEAGVTKVVRRSDGALLVGVTQAGQAAQAIAEYANHRAEFLESSTRGEEVASQVHAEFSESITRGKGGASPTSAGAAQAETRMQVQPPAVAQTSPGAAPARSDASISEGSDGPRAPAATVLAAVEANPPLTVRGKPRALRAFFEANGITAVVPRADGVVIGRSQSAQARQLMELHAGQVPGVAREVPSSPAPAAASQDVRDMMDRVLQLELAAGRNPITPPRERDGGGAVPADGMERVQRSDTFPARVEAPSSTGAGGGGSAAAPPFSATMNPSGTLTVTGDQGAIRQVLTDAGVTRFVVSNSGAMVGKSDAAVAQEALERLQVSQHAEFLQSMRAGKEQAADNSEIGPFSTAPTVNDFGQLPHFPDAQSGGAAMDESRGAQGERAEGTRRASEEARARADADRGEFSLTGSDLPADANPAQQDLLAPTQPAGSAAASKSLSDLINSPLSSLSPPQAGEGGLPNLNGVRNRKGLLERLLQLGESGASLTLSLREVGVGTIDRAAILARARVLRAEGLDTKAAAKKAVQERLDAVSALLRTAVMASVRKVEPAAEPKIEDLGEKIGGARKDTATSTGTRARRAGEEDTRPAWTKRFNLSEIVATGEIDQKNVGRWVIHDARTKDRFGQARPVGGWNKTFATKDEAEAFLPLAAVSMKHRAVPTSAGKYEIWRDVTDRKRVKVVDQVFDTRDEATAYMAQHAGEILETNTTFGEADLPLPPDRARTGSQRRTGDVKGDDFLGTFGFRGVEFGNWNAQTERQALMNDAYDGLLDLAEVLGVPPKALGLNGDLALAFGARGQGLNSARAHYEHERAVINLTKENGAGSLAHEWFHGLDHYFGRQDGKASSEWKTNADGTRELAAKGAEADMASHGFRVRNSGVRDEVRQAYEALITTMFKKGAVYVEDTAKADKFTAAAKEDLARELDSLRKELSEQKDVRYWKRNNKPASAEQLAEFDTIARRMLEGEAQALTTDWRSVETAQKRIAHRWTNDSLEQMGAIYKAVRGRSGFDSTNRNGLMDRLQGYMKRYGQRLQLLADAQKGAEKTRMVPTDFAMNAKELDQGRGGDYWTTPHEMAARAFQGYVEDKIAAAGGMSRFLNYGPENAGILTPWGAKRPFPAGEERKAINAALDRFFKVLETEATDTGVRLYKRSDEPTVRAPRVAQTQLIVDQLTKTWKNGPKVSVVATVADLPGDNPPDVRGLYDRGRVYVVADSAEHRTRAGVARTLAHEAVAHYGLRNMLGRDGWERLMRDIQLGVKAKNKALVRISEYVRSIYVDEEGAFNLSPDQEADEIAARAMEEAIDEDGNFRPGFAFLKSVWAKVAQFLRDLGLDVTFTHAELQGMLVDSMRNLEAGARTVGGGQMAVAAARDDGPMHHRAFHGTPHDFDQFTTEKMGSGEGNQSYGWGLYFAEEKKVADGYRKTLSQQQPAIDGKPIDGMNPRHIAAATLDLYGGDKAKAVEDLQLTVDRPDLYPDGADTVAREAIGIIQRGDQLPSVQKKQGSLYQVEIPDETVAKMLLWDKQMADQPTHVQAALRTLLKESGSPLTFDELADRDWRDVKDNVLVDMSEDAISKRLDELGVPGVKYLDGQSRNRPLKQVKREFLAELPEDADFDEVLDLIGDGTFSPQNEAILKALAADDWLGFDYPAQAISAALGGDLTSYDASDALVKAVADAQVDATYNLVVFNDKNIEITHKDGTPVTKQERADFVEAAHADDAFNGTQHARSATASGQQQAAAPARSVTASLTWDTPEPTKADKVLYELQDGRIDLRRATEAIKAAGREIEERFDARLAETLYPGRVAHRSHQFLENEVKPLLVYLAANRVKIDEISDFLIARHAPERNAQVAKVNPSMPDGGAGRNSKGELMTTRAAEDYLAGLDPTRRTVLATAAARIDAITAGTRKLLVDEGLEKPGIVAAWESAYQFYAPLFKDEAEAGVPHSIGTGFNVRGPASKRATGSERQVTDVLGHVLMQREAAMTRAEKNRVGLSLYGMILSHPNPGFWTTIRPGMSPGEVAEQLAAMGVDPEEAAVAMEGVPTIRSVDPKTNLVVERPNPLYKNLPGAITLRVAGQDRVILLNVRDERAKRLAASLKNLDGLTALDLANSIIGRATRWIASVNTAYNPVFGFVNVIRDVQNGVVNLSTTKLAGHKMEILGHVPAALIGIARDLRGDAKRTEWSDLFNEFQEAGGQTGYRELFRDAADRTRAIEKELQQLDSSGLLTAGKAVHAVLDLLDDFNTSLENAMRLSAYKVGIDSGLSKAEAARTARELTVDFNRKGRVGRELGPLYAFFNASVQGTARTIQTLKGPAGAKIIAGGIALGALQALMLAAAGYDQDDLPEYIKSRNLIIPTAWRSDRKTYIAIPIGLGLHVLPNTGRIITELALSGGKDLPKKAGDAIGEVLGAFNPLGGANPFTLDGALKTLAPTVVDPAIELGFNRNFAGGQIERKPFNEEGDNRPGFSRARESTQRSATGQVYLAISKAINSRTGGTDYEAGAASPTPEAVRYLAQVAGGGVLRELEKAVNASVDVTAGRPVKLSAIPLTGRFFGEVDTDAVEARRFFEAKSRINRAQSSLRAAEGAGDLESYRRISSDRPEFALHEALQQTQRSITELNKLAVETVSDPEKIRAIDVERQREMKALNDALRRLESQSPTPAGRLRALVE